MMRTARLYMCKQFSFYTIKYTIIVISLRVAQEIGQAFVAYNMKQRLSTNKRLQNRGIHTECISAHSS